MNKDIAYCQGHGCNATVKCAHHAPAVKFIYQEYFTVTPGKDETCEHFIKKLGDGKN